MSKKKTNHQQFNFTSWWFQTIWKMRSSNCDHFPKVQGENDKNLWVFHNHLVIHVCIYIYIYIRLHNPLIYNWVVFLIIPYKRWPFFSQPLQTFNWCPQSSPSHRFVKVSGASPETSPSCGTWDFQHGWWWLMMYFLLALCFFYIFS